MPEAHAVLLLLDVQYQHLPVKVALSDGRFLLLPQNIQGFDQLQELQGDCKNVPD